MRSTDGVVLFDLETGRLLDRLPTSNRPTSVSFDGTGSLLTNGFEGCFRWPVKAVADFSKALELNPRCDLALENRSRAYALRGQWQKTVADCTLLVARTQGQRQINGYQRRAQAYTALGRYQQARDDHQKLVELSPSSSLAHNNLSWFLTTCPDAAIHDPGRAVQLAQRALDLEERVGNTWNTLGAAHYRARRLQGCNRGSGQIARVS